jgi:hypothetical protein
MQEEWRPVVERDGAQLSERYEVSSHGRIRSWIRADRQPGRASSPRLLKGNRQYRGHINVALRVDRRNQYRFVHQLVAWAFIGPQPSATPVVRHIDGDPSNNRVENLRFGTAHDNFVDRYRYGVGVGHTATPVFLSAEEIRVLAESCRWVPERHADVLQAIVAQFEENGRRLLEGPNSRDGNGGYRK